MAGTLRPTQLPFPARASRYLDSPKPASIYAVGNAALLDEPLLGLLASRECPGHILLETLERVPQWVQEDRVLISGFHSPLEQQVLRSLLRRHGRLVKVLAKTIEGYRAPPMERDALDAGRLLVISPFPAAVRRTTRKTALERNRLMMALAAKLIAPHVREQSPLAELLKAIKENE